MQPTSEQPVSDDKLIHQYREGETVAFEAIYSRYAPRLLGFLRNLVGGPSSRNGQADTVAEDLAQQTWFRVINRIESYRPQNQFRAWLFRLAHRIWIDDLRRNQARVSVTLEETHLVPTSDQGPLERQITKETKDQINRAIETLPDSMRETLLLRIDGQLTCREIAETLECPLGTVLWRLREARQRLTKILDT